MSTLENSSTTLPPEILYLIVDAIGNLSSSDLYRKHGLKACNLVSRSFSHIARQHLFHTLSLAFRDRGIWQNGVEIFTGLITDAPTADNSPEYNLLPLQCCVKELFIHCPTTMSGSQLHNSESLNGFDVDKHLRTIFDALHGPDHGIHTLTISWTYGDRWTKWNPSLQKSFSRILRSSRLRYLSIEQMFGLPLSIFRGTNITHLHISGCYTSPGGGIPLADSSSSLKQERLPFPRLKYLDTDCSLPVDFYGPELSALEGLETMSITLHYDFATAYRHILQRPRVSIKRLNISCIGKTFSRLSDFNIAFLRHLRHLYLRHGGQVDNNLYLSPRQLLGLMLDQFGRPLGLVIAPPSLSTIELEFALYGKELKIMELLLESVDAHGEKWARLDAALAKLDSCLRHVSFKFHIQARKSMRTWCMDSSNGNALEVLQSVLQLTTSFARLSVDFVFSNKKMVAGMFAGPMVDLPCILPDSACEPYWESLTGHLF